MCLSHQYELLTSWPLWRCCCVSWPPFSWPALSCSSTRPGSLSGKFLMTNVSFAFNHLSIHTHEKRLTANVWINVDWMFPQLRELKFDSPAVNMYWYFEIFLFTVWPASQARIRKRFVWQNIWLHQTEIRIIGDVLEINCFELKKLEDVVREGEENNDHNVAKSLIHSALKWSQVKSALG